MAAAAEAREVDVTFTVTVPPNTPADDTVYIAGDFQGWDPGGTPMDRVDAATWSITLPFTEGEPPQYKYTAGHLGGGREGRRPAVSWQTAPSRSRSARAGPPMSRTPSRSGATSTSAPERRLLYSPFVSDLPVALPDPLARRLAAALDVEGKIPRALDALGPLADRDVAWSASRRGSSSTG